MHIQDITYFKNEVQGDETVHFYILDQNTFYFFFFTDNLTLYE